MEDGEIPAVVNVSEIAQKKEDIGVVDVRDYFRITSFHKRAEQIDPTPEHHWDTVNRFDILLHSDYGDCVAGETYDPEVDFSKSFGILIAERTSDGQNSSIFTNELNQDQRGWVLDSINSTAPRLGDEQRHIYMREVIHMVPSLKDLKDYQIAKQLAEVTLKVIPDSNTSQTGNFDLAWANEQPSPEQQAEIKEFLTLVGQKLPPDKLNDRVKQLVDDARWIDDPFGKNHAGLFSSLQGWVMDDRGMDRKFDLLHRPNPAEYKISDRVTTPITSEGELRERLAQLPAEDMPDTMRLPRGKQSAEMVQLVEVVGGSGIKDWTVSTSEGRVCPKYMS